MREVILEDVSRTTVHQSFVFFAKIYNFIENISSLNDRTANIGQIFVGLAGPICQGGPPALSATWFPANQRTTSTAIATVALVIGTSFSFLIGPNIVTNVKTINSTE